MELERGCGVVEAVGKKINVCLMVICLALVSDLDFLFVFYATAVQIAQFSEEVKNRDYCQNSDRCSATSYGVRKFQEPNEGISQKRLLCHLDNINTECLCIDVLMRSMLAKSRRSSNEPIGITAESGTY